MNHDEKAQVDVAANHVIERGLWHKPIFLITK
jgi:hypothetical protein